MLIFISGIVVGLWILNLKGHSCGESSGVCSLHKKPNYHDAEIPINNFQWKIYGFIPSEALYLNPFYLNFEHTESHCIRINFHNYNFFWPMRYLMQFSCVFSNYSTSRDPIIYLHITDPLDSIQSTYSLTNDSKLNNCQKWRNIQFMKTDYDNYTFIYGCENTPDNNSHYDGLWIFVNARYPPSPETQAMISQIIETHFVEIKQNITFVNSFKTLENCSCQTSGNKVSCAADSDGVWNNLLLYSIPIHVSIVIFIIYKCAYNKTKRCVLCF